MDVSLIGKRGDDPHGKYLDGVLQKEKVCLRDLVVDHGSPTAQCYVFRHEREEYSFFNWPRPNASHLLTENEVTESMIEGAEFLHATGISLTIAPRRHAVIKAFRIAKGLGVPISFDAGFPTGEDREAREFALTALKTADIVKVNLSELEFWADALARESKNELPAESKSGVPANKPLAATITEPLDAASCVASDQVVSLGRKLSGFLQSAEHSPNLIVTLGAYGSLLIAGDGKDVFAPALKADSVSELGAGDAFIAGMIAELLNFADGKKLCFRELKESDWWRVLTVGNAVGALSTRSMTAWEGLPTRQELSLLVKTVV